jgi:hypothetical protein
MPALAKYPVLLATGGRVETIFATHVDLFAGVEIDTSEPS